MAATAPTVERPQPAEAQPMGWPRALLAMTRPTHIALVIVIFANGAMLAAWRGASAMEAVPMALLLLVAASVATHLANEAADHETDRLSRRTPFSGGSGALEASRLDPRVPLVVALVVAAATLLGATAASAIGALPPAAAVLLVVGLAGGLAYSLPPFAAMRRGWGEALNATLGAMVLPLYGVATLAAAVGVLDVIAFAPFLFVTFASVMATAWPDRDADAATGKRTLQVRLSPRALRRLALLAASAFVASTILSVAAAAMPLATVGLLVTPLLALGLVRYTRVEDPVANVAAMVGLAIITFLVLAVTLAGDGSIQ